MEQLLADIRRACRKSPEESYNRANERQRLSAGFQAWLIGHETLMAAVVIALQLAVTLVFMIRLIPTWMDNSYRHENRADNLGSLRRQVPAGPGMG